MWKRPGASRRQFEMAGKENPWMMEILRRCSVKYAIRQNRWWTVWMGVLPPIHSLRMLQVIANRTTRKMTKSRKKMRASKNKVTAWLPGIEVMQQISLKCSEKPETACCHKRGPTWAHLFLDHYNRRRTFWERVIFGISFSSKVHLLLHADPIRSIH